MTIEVACSQVPYPNKDEDAFVLREIGDHFILAVADGLSMRNGRAAARWVAEHIDTTKATDCIYLLYDNLVDCLRNVTPGQTESETTLSCGILRPGSRPRTLVFEYFAIGDSPIWKLVQSGDDRYPYQRYLVSGSPYPAENAKLYSTVSLHDRNITGPVTFGSVTILEEEVLVVCSDGLPEREILVRDLPRENSLCRWLFGKAPYTSQSMQEVLSGYGSRDIFVDDTTVIAARLLKPERQQNEEVQSHTGEVPSIPQGDSAPVSVLHAEASIASENSVADSTAVSTDASAEAPVADVPLLGVQVDTVASIEPTIEARDNAQRGRKERAASLVAEVPQPGWAPVSASPAEALIAAEKAVADSIAAPAEASLETPVSDVPIQEIQVDTVAPIEQSIEQTDSAERGRKRKTASLLAPPAKSSQPSATKKPNRGKAGGA